VWNSTGGGWVESGLQPTWTDGEARLLSDFLGCVLRTDIFAPPISHGCAYELEEPSSDFDVAASPEHLRMMLLALGWNEGLPTASQLTSHILDRLESECACDIACEEGPAGEALSDASAASFTAQLEAVARRVGIDLGI